MTRRSNQERKHTNAQSVPPQNSTSPPAQSACLSFAIDSSVQLLMLMASSLLSHQSLISKMVFCIAQRAIAFKTIQAGRT